ncbi:MAG: HAD-IC family P-type ATPase [Bacteroidota bacterium]
MSTENFNIKGLSNEEVLNARAKHGDNSLNYKKENTFLDAVKSLAKEPMVILLLVASTIYFISGNIGDGLFLTSAIVLVSTISLYQDSRSRGALEKLKSFTQASCKVVREGETVEIKSEELVLGDHLIIEEGTSIAADGTIIHSNDFSVNESILTGESMAVYKDQSKDNNLVFRGTNVVSGLAIAVITAIGNETKLGKIGKSLEEIKEEKTPLERQIGNFVKKMVIVGAIVFLIVWVINYLHSYNILDSLLKALTLAMSILPEEIPVAFTTFMALGAWRLMKMGIVVKQMKTVETLGSATVICTDKTGTITENKMSLAKVFVGKVGKINSPDKHLGEEEKELIRLAMWASEPIPFDPMEVALHAAYAEILMVDERTDYKIVHEYPLGGKPPMMTHVFENHHGVRIIAAKGAAEGLMELSNLSDDERKQLEDAINALAADGYRVLGVGEAFFTGNNFPLTQQEFKFAFKGLVAFYDPPKKNIQAVFNDFYKAGIDVKIVTGDNAATTAAIAKQIGFIGHEKYISGNELMELDDKALKETVTNTQVFTRMFPEAKLKIINALKSNNEIVAMTGDGVNDGPALKASHIGIAMGTGTDIAIESAQITLIKGDLEKLVTALKLSHATVKTIRQNLFWAFFYNLVTIPLAAGVLYPFTGFMLNPMIAGATMAFSSVSVVSNSLRLRSKRID